MFASRIGHLEENTSSFLNVSKLHKNQNQDFSTYVGEFEDGKPDGFGTHTHQENVYKGEQISRIGIYCLGHFKKGLRHGQGEYITKEGQIFSGEFLDNELRKGRLEFGDGRIYDGEWNFGLMNGKGKMIEEDGTVYR